MGSHFGSAAPSNRSLPCRVLCAVSIHQRSDTCAVVPGAVIAQAQVALVLADALLEHVGGYSLAQVRENLQAYQKRVEARL